MSFDSFRSMGGAGRGLALGPGEGAALELPGWSMRVKIAASDTGGALTLIESVMEPAHKGPLEHVHTGHDESFFVISGQLRFRVGDGFKTVTSGDTIFASRGLAHGFANPGSDPARYLVALTPSGYEFYFERLATLIRRQGSMPSREELLRLMAEHGTFPAEPLTAEGAPRNGL